MRVGEDNKMKILFPEIYSELHPIKNEVLSIETVSKGLFGSMFER
jgi:hypothetical protein